MGQVEEGPVVRLLVDVSEVVFQAEYGIRCYKVTGVQTCALPISIHRLRLDLTMHHQTDARSDALAVSEHLHRQKRAGIPLTSDDYRSWALAEDLMGNKIVA